MIAFVSGGARSGKSETAEQLVLQWSEGRAQEGGSIAYIASAQRSDDEMELRIQYHLERRDEAWTTYELPAASSLGGLLRRMAPKQPVLLDCMTIWLSRMLFEESREEAEIEAHWSECLQLCRDRKLAIVIVSNDLNEGLPTADEWTRKYVQLLERLHRLTVEEADVAVQTVAGIPLVRKGEL